jgi:hypothetical protein
VREPGRGKGTFGSLFLTPGPFRGTFTMFSGAHLGLIGKSGVKPARSRHCERGTSFREPLNRSGWGR